MTNYIHQTNDVIDSKPKDRAKLTHKSTSISAATTDAELKELGWLPQVVVGFEPFDPVTQIRTGPTGCNIGDPVPEDADDITCTYIVEFKPLEDLKAQRCDEVDALRDQKSSSDFTHGGRTFDANKNAQKRINYTISYGHLGSISSPTNRTWTLADNSTVTLNWGELRSMAMALFERADGYHAVARDHKDAVGLLTTVQEVLDYVITANW